jgi:chemotaxis protein histidine kinase CheA
MALEQKYKKAFQSECNVLSQAVLGSLLRLAANPKDKQELSKLVQSADTIMGDARFLEDKKLEQSATDIVKSFTGTGDVRKKIDQFGAAFEQFGLLVGQSGACPKGYILVNGKCVLDIRSNAKSKTTPNS